VIRRDYGAFLLRQPDAKASAAAATPHLEAAAVVASFDHGLQLLRATAKHQSGQSAEAERLLREIIDRKPKWPPARIALARLFTMQDKPEQAIATLREGMSAAPQSAAMYRVGLIGLLLEKGRPAEALAELRVDRPDLSPGQAYATLGEMLRSKGQADAAAAFAASAPPDVRDDASFLNWHGSVLLSQSKFPDAERQFRRAVERDAKLAGAWTNLATSLLAQRRPDDAERELKAAVKAGPNAAACYMLGNLALGRRETDAALALFEQAVRLDPTHAPALNNLATLLAMKGRTEEALPHLRACVARDPSHAKAHASLAAILFEKKDYPAARHHYEQALAGKDRPNSAVQGLAWMLATSPDCTPDDAKLALKLAEEACDKTGYTSAPALDALAAAHAAAGDYAKAATIAENLVNKTRAEGRQELSEQVARRAALYRQNKPYRRSAK
jgi:tetratricopeptide (TPR) repeat protein